MNKVFCSECGAKHEYSANKPKFCSECGESLSGGGSASAAKREKYQDGDDEEGDFDRNTSLSLKISANRPPSITFGEIVEEGVPSSSEGKLKRKSGIRVDDILEKARSGSKISID